MPEQIINKLRESEILLGQGNVIAPAAKKIGVKNVISASVVWRWLPP